MCGCVIHSDNLKKTKRWKHIFHQETVSPFSREKVRNINVVLGLVSEKVRETKKLKKISVKLVEHISVVFFIVIFSINISHCTGLQVDLPPSHRENLLKL